MILFIEPDFKKFAIASKKLNNILCLNSDIKEINANEIKPKSRIVTIIMQDVIEHISIDKQKIFFQELFSNYEEIYFIGRTPNLKSPFGMRNSFGDNEDYKITGITSLFRYLPYLLTILLVSLIFLIIFGSWEGFLTPNIVFKAQKINKKLL